MRDKPVAFEDVNVVPMDKERVLRDQIVIVDKHRIAQMGERDKVKIPEDALRIDGSGKYLMPGLADMHTHTWGEADLLLFIANGVTTIRNMWGSHRQLAWRQRIANGEMLGPTIFTAGPLVDGSPPVWNSSKVVVTAEEAEKEISSEKDLGYDFVKVYTRLSLDAYQAILASAKKFGMPVAGHIPNAVGLERALEAGQNSIEHLTGYIEAIQADDSPVKNRFDPQSRWKIIDYADEGKIPRIVAATKAANAWNCVTLVVTQKFVAAEDAGRLVEDPRMRFVPPDYLASWDPSKDFRLKDMTALDFKRIRRADEMRARFTRELHKAGARILLGTDTPNPFVIPGFSIHEELQNLVKAGLSPYDAIKAGTKDAAEFLHGSDDFGTVEVGKRADLILLEANPLENVGNISHPRGVVVRGRWYSKEELIRMLDELIATYAITQERLDSLFEPLSSSGDGIDQLHSSYWIKSTDTLLGEERFALQRSQAGRILISSQALMSAPPRINSFLMRMELNDDWTPISLRFESHTSEGTTKAKTELTQGRLKVSRNHPQVLEFEIEKDEAEEILLGSPHIASFVPIIKRLRLLDIGQTLNLTMMKLETEPELDVVEVRLQLERKSDIEKQDKNGRTRSFRQYNMTETRSNASYTGSLLVDDMDRMTLLERAEQMGLTRFELAEK